MHSLIASLLPLRSTASADPSLIETNDGRKVRVSPVTPRDADAERDFIGALSLASRYRRFHFGLRELTTEQAREMTAIDQHHHVALVARPIENAAAPIVADARYVVRADSAEAEFAIAIADAWQGAGLGRALLTRLLVHAREQRIDRLYGDILWENPAMLALARGMGARLMRNPGDSTSLRAEFVIGETRSTADPACSSAAHRGLFTI